VRGDVAGLDLVLELGQAGGVDVGRLRDDHLAGLWIDPALLERGGLLGLVEQLLLEVGGKDQLVDAEVAGLALHPDARVPRRAGLLLVGRQQRVLQGQHQLLLRDALLSAEDAHGVDDLLRHAQSPRRLDRWMSV
jgi:hypothetical protein